MFLCFFLLVSCDNTQQESTSTIVNTPKIIDDAGLVQVQLTSSEGNEIIVAGVEEGQIIQSPLKLSGQVPSSWVFEGSFPITIIDNNNKVLAEWYGTAEWIDQAGNFIEWPVPFTSELSFDISQSEAASGIIRFGKDIVGDDDTPDVVDIAVSWRDQEEESGQDPIDSIPQGLSDVEAGIVDYISCEAAGDELKDNTCTSTDGRVFENEESGQDPAGSIPDGLSHVEAGMVDYESCEAGGWEIQENTCTTFDGRVFEK